MKNLVNKSTALLIATALTSSLALAQKNKEPNIPEYEAEKYAAASSGTPRMKCLVDTPAWDQWGYSVCFSSGYSTYATAYFTIENLPSNYTIYWSDSRCSQTSGTCSVPIRQYQQITMTADVLDRDTNTFVTTSSTAHYEGMH